MSKLIVLACAPLVSGFSSSMQACMANADCTQNPGEFCIPTATPEGDLVGTICWETPGGAGPTVGGLGMEWCEPGTYAPLPVNSLQCTRCPNGKFQPEAEQSECLCVPGGERAVGFYPTSTEPCPIGMYYPEDCHPTAGCIPCDRGSFVNSTGNLECDCSEPGYQGNDARDAPEECPAGQYSGECEACMQCPPGKFSNESGSSACEDAPKGTHPNEDQTGTVECQPGFEQPLAGQSSCTSCPVGKYTGSTGSTGCECAGDGKRPTADATDTQDCPSGIKSELDETAGCHLCTSCMEGRYSLDEGSESCVCADPGHRPAADAGSQVPCEGGFFSEFCSATCTICEPGTFSAPGEASCTNCSAGKFAVGSGTTACAPAAPGHFAPAGGVAALPCERGYYQDEPEQAECKLCAIGKFANVSAMTTCYNARVGHTSATEPNVATGYSVEVPCPAGKIAAEEGVACTLCELGKYQKETGQSECICVDPGYVSNESRKGQFECPPDYTQPESCGMACVAKGGDVIIASDDDAEESSQCEFFQAQTGAGCESCTAGAGNMVNGAGCLLVTSASVASLGALVGVGVYAGKKMQKKSGEGGSDPEAQALVQ